MRDILQAFADHCDRHHIDKRPRVWARHWNIWGEPQGEIGIPLEDDDGEALALFAAMVPFMAMPTIGLSWLIVDRTTEAARHLTVARFSVSTEGIFYDPWIVPYTMSDTGAMTYGPAMVGMELTFNCRDSVNDVLRGRHRRIAWEEDITFDRAVAIAEDLIGS